MPVSTVDEALSDIREGKVIILVDDEDRENEGDFMVAAEKVTPDIINFPVKKIATGSLLMLQSDGLEILYDPAYSEHSGSGFCQISISDDISDNCSIICGDADASGGVDIDDVVYLIAYIFSGGPEPLPEYCIGDADGSGGVDIDDVVYLINYIFASGPPPVEECCE